jgi:hypothetical protein
MKVSGINGETRVRYWAVPVAGRFESIGLFAYPKKTAASIVFGNPHFLFARA